MDHISLDDASKRWNISKNTIIKYISEGVIANLKIENNRLLLPDINKPHYVGKRKSIIQSKEIIRAVERSEYVDYLLLSISKKEFDAIMRWMINEKYLIETIPSKNHYDNRKVKLAPRVSSKSIHFPLTINATNSISVNNKLNAQVGLANNGINL